MIKKHAIIVHLYYSDLWEEFKSRIEPIMKRGDVDLYVTITEDDISVKDDVEKLTRNVYVLSNKGLDIGPFIYVMDKIKDLEYTSIFKIHTKKSLHHGIDPMIGIIWRNTLIDSLIGDEEIFDEITKIIEDEPISMIGSTQFLSNFKVDAVNLPHHYEVIKRTIGLLNLKISESRNNQNIIFSKNGKFFAGTMFATSHKYIKEVFSSCDMLNFYENLPLGYVYNSNAHAMERIFGYYVEELGGNFYEID